MFHVSIKAGSSSFEVGNDLPLTVFGGLCVLDGYDLAVEVQETLAKATRDLGLNFVFKASFDKANRSRWDSYRGPGLDAGIAIFERLSPDIPIMTDVHTPEQAEALATVVEVLQIPALLSRQLDLLKATVATGLPVNIKKGQFMAPKAVVNIVENAEAFASLLPYGNRPETSGVMLTERGASYGSGDLVVDPRSLHYMRGVGYPVILDCTHSCQAPQGGATTGGNIDYAEPIARSGVAQGIAGVFFETHPTPASARSDGANSLPLSAVSEFLERLVRIDRAVKGGDCLD